MKDFEVKLTIGAKDKEAVERMLDRMPGAERIYDCEIIDPDEKRFEERIRYVEDWYGDGEHFVFEGKWTDEDEWSLDSAFPLKNDMIHYQALTKIREMMRNDVPFRFVKGG